MKKYYYIGIMDNNKQNDEVKYVYNMDTTNKIVEWKKYSEMKDNERPLLFTKTSAENIVHGLNCNFILAFVITTYIELR